MALGGPFATHLCCNVVRDTSSAPLGGDSGHYPRNLDREYDRDHLNRDQAGLYQQASASTTTGYDSNMDERHGYGDHSSSADGDREYQNYPEDGFGRQSEVQ